MRPQTDRDADVGLVRQACAALDAGNTDVAAHYFEHRWREAFDRLVADLNAAEARLAEVEAEREGYKSALVRITRCCDISCIDPTDPYCECNVDDMPTDAEEVVKWCWAGMAHEALGHVIEAPPRDDDEGDDAALKAASEGEKP